jgi:hypothetical protein
MTPDRIDELGALLRENLGASGLPGFRLAPLRPVAVG